MRGPESTNRMHRIRACIRYPNQASLCLSGLVYSLGDPLGGSVRQKSCDLPLLAGDAECHQLYKGPASPLGVLLLSVVLVVDP